jgi:hypothetical protein
MPGRIRGCLPPGLRFILWARSASAAKAEWPELLSNANTATHPGWIALKIGIALSISYLL